MRFAHAVARVAYRGHYKQCLREHEVRVEPASPGGLHPETQGSKSPMSTETDTKLIALGERFEKLFEADRAR